MRFTTVATTCVALGSAAVVRADTDISLYGDTDVSGHTDGTRAGTTAAFSVPTLDLFTSSTGGRWTFLSETLFEAEGDNSFGVDVERVEVGYLFSEWLRVRIGRFHTALGYYNDGFHHGTYFMLPAGRPRMVEFEDKGGLIPAHNVGVHFDGRIGLGDDRLRYDLEIVNGRGPTADEIQNLHDANLAKAVNVRLRYEPGGALEGLIVGGNFYVDTIPPLASDALASGATAHPTLREVIAGAHVVYIEEQLHVIAEGLAIHRAALDGTLGTTTWAAFVEVGRSFEDFTPYLRLEATRYPSTPDPFSPATEPSYQVVRLGAKHATTENIALKGELSLELPSGQDAVYGAIGQVAFAF